MNTDELSLFSFELVDLSDLNGASLVKHDGCGGGNGTCTAGCGCGKDNGNCGGAASPSTITKAN